MRPTSFRITRTPSRMRAKCVSAKSKKKTNNELLIEVIDDKKVVSA